MLWLDLPLWFLLWLQDTLSKNHQELKNNTSYKFWKLHATPRTTQGDWGWGGKRVCTWAWGSAFIGVAGGDSLSVGEFKTWEWEFKTWKTKISDPNGQLLKSTKTFKTKTVGFVGVCTTCLLVWSPDWLCVHCRQPSLAGVSEMNEA